MNATNPIGNFNPFAQMGMNTNDPNMYQNMMDSPQAQEMMRQALSNPAVIDQIIQQSPQLQNMGPQFRQMMQSEQFRNMITNPDTMRQMMQQAQQMQALMGQGGGFGGGMPFGGPFGGMGGFGGMPGAAATGTQAGGQQPATGGPRNLFDPAAATAATGTGAAAPSGAAAGAAPAQMPDFGALAQMLNAGGDMGGMGNPFGGMGGFGGGFGSPPAQPAQQDTRPPEERFASQLTQLQEMGFVNGQANIRALLACGGNVQAAIEYILNSQSW